jgi:hypothetical protein
LSNLHQETDGPDPDETLGRAQSVARHARELHGHPNQEGELPGDS